ncbi:D-2-hydroxyacid dehydrogenase [Flagellimonas meridianipacifica]|uniref:D-3-phosphoglycerate dehydrogenase n=1 Tax=Flagellimonas meridianipacifica TaxID=1080225 RepID=A0A2T0MC90_9FLAO|nr:D-2-hydroxyacid dehydrogenase [Allomuricauda pacifica]PRX55085.1 D-3-phosphoglycerate dehydrogenase [Allomuricauda pacifica]
MHKVLANDGISQSGIDALEKEGIEVIVTKVAPEQLENYINQNGISVLLVRSATKVTKSLIDACPGLKLIGRGGVGMDNIDVEYAKSKGIHVINTPASSSQSVAELVFGHLLNGVRFLHNANRDMPLEGDSNFKQLKKSYSEGHELKGKTLGIIGFGRIGRATAQMGLGMGMKVLFNDHHHEEADLTMDFFDGQSVTIKLTVSKLDELLKQSDFISIHVPSQKNGYVLGKNEFEMMKAGAGIVNASRGGIIDEVALVEALNSEKLAFAGLDVFESEPNPEIKILMHPKISLSPHIGASTNEAQDRIGLELATQITSLLN